MSRIASVLGLVVVSACLANVGRNAAGQETTPATAFERRLADASIKGAMQQVGSALIASGRDATREAARNVLGEWYWAFYDDVRLEAAEREAAEIAFDDSFALVSKTAAERKIDSLMVVGIDDVASPRCMRWYFLSIGPQGPALFSVVVYQANDKPRLRDLRTLTDFEQVEAAMNAVEHPTGDQVFTIQVAPPRTDGSPSSATKTGGEAQSQGN